MQFLATGNPSNGYRARITINQGETVKLAMQFYDVTGTPLQLNGYAIKAAIAFPSTFYTR